ERLVSANENAVIILVRHAQDSDDYDGEVLKFAEAEVIVTLLDEPTPSSGSRREVFRGVINAPTGEFTVGDADTDTVVPAHAGLNSVLVFVDSQVPPDDLSPDEVWVDLLPGLAL
ncbi:MAG TPA: hypothetical protein VKA85_10300, partial [Candidatus Limnocylindrales bacterium]|nr:hypothetical protein [Candidatus Limnocylindrales bacterium]